MPGTVNLSKIAYSVLSVPYPGEKESGDLYLIEETPEKALIAIVDGAGHGHGGVFPSDPKAGRATRQNCGIEATGTALLTRGWRR